MKLLPDNPDNKSRAATFNADIPVEEPPEEVEKTEEQQYSYDNITILEIKTILGERGIEYTNDMKKQELFDLL